LEFYSFIRELIPAEEFGYPPLATDEEQPRAIPKQYQTVLTEEQLAQVIEELQQSGGFAVDTETTSEQPMKAELVGVSVATIPHQGYYIPVGHRYIGAPQQLPLDLVIQRLKPLLEDATLPKYGQNIKYDIIVLAHYGIHLQGAAFDSMLASYVLDPSKRSHGMDYLAQEYLQYQTITYHDVVGKGVKQTTIDMIPVERVTEYAAEDADITLQLTNVLKPKIQEQQLEQLYQEVELPLIDVLAAMERHGVKVDIALLERISRELSEKMRGIEQRIYQIAGVEFNINSPNS
jgi:DNA polymerase-1